MFRPANWSLLIPVLTTFVLALPEPAAAQDPVWTPPAWVMSPTDIEQFKREKNSAKNVEAMKSKSPSPAHTAIAHKAVHYYLSELVHHDDQNLPKDVIDKFIQELTSPLISIQIRDVMLAEVVPRVLELMDHPKPIVRFNAVNLLNHCSVSKPGLGVNPTPPKAFVQGMTALIPIATDHDQLWIVRNLAVIGLGRILEQGEPSSNERSEIATALLSVLKAAEGEEFLYRLRAVEALGYANRIDLTTGVPEILDAIMGVLSDKKEHFMVRSQAALSISRLPWNASINEPLIMEKVGELLEGMSLAQKANPNLPVWRQCFGRVYLAFRPSTLADAQTKKWGFLYKGAPIPSATAALWKLAFPILRPIVENEQPPATPAELITPLTTHLGTKAANRKVHVNSKGSY